MCTRVEVGSDHFEPWSFISDDVSGTLGKPMVTKRIWHEGKKTSVQDDSFGEKNANAPSEKKMNPKGKLLWFTIENVGWGETFDKTSIHFR